MTDKNDFPMGSVGNTMNFKQLMMHRPSDTADEFFLRVAKFIDSRPRSEDSRAAPAAWLRFWSACRAPDDCDSGLEVCQEGDKGVDGSPAFPVFALATTATPSGPAQEQAVSVHPVVNLLLDVAGLAYDLMDNTEERGPKGHRELVIQPDDFDALSEAMDKLEALPDDQPGIVMGPAAKAAWALRTPPSPAVRTLTDAEIVAIMDAAQAEWGTGNVDGGLRLHVIKSVLSHITAPDSAGDTDAKGGA